VDNIYRRAGPNITKHNIFGKFENNEDYGNTSKNKYFKE